MFLPLWFAESMMRSGNIWCMFWESLSTSKICEYHWISAWCIKVRYVASLNDHEWSKGWGKQLLSGWKMGDGMRRSGMFEELAAWVARIYALQKCCHISMVSKSKHLLGENHPPWRWHLGGRLNHGSWTWFFPKWNWDEHDIYPGRITHR